MHISRLAKSIVGVERIKARGIAIDGAGALVIDAEPYRAQPCRCGKCGRGAPRCGAGRGVRLWRCCDVGGMKAHVRSEAFRASCPECGTAAREAALGRARTTAHVRLRGRLLLVRALDEQGGLPEAHEGVLADRGLDMPGCGGEALRGAPARARRARADRRGRGLAPQGMQVHDGHREPRHGGRRAVP